MASAPEPDDLPISGVTIPDDPRDLDADRWAYYEELSRAGRTRHTPDQPATDHPSRWREGQPWFGYRGSRVSPLIFLIVSVIAMAASVLVALVPRADAPQQTRTLTAPTADIGQLGGLMPNAAVGINGAPRLLRDIRPAIIAVIPEGPCPECADAMAAAANDAADAGVRLFVAGSREQAGELEELAAPHEALTMTYLASPFDVFRPTGVTLVLVAPDGAVTDVVRMADGVTSVYPTAANWSTPTQ